MQSVCTLMLVPEWMIIVGQIILGVMVVVLALPIFLCFTIWWWNKVDALFSSKLFNNAQRRYS